MCVKYKCDECSRMHAPWMTHPNQSQSVKVGSPSSVLVKGTQGEGAKPGIHGPEQDGTRSIQNKEEGGLFLYFSILQRKNELGYEQKIHNVVGSSLCLIQIDESGWEN